RALGTARSGDPARARQDVAKLQALHDALVAAKQSYWAEQVEIQHRAAAAWLARAVGKAEEAMTLMRAATDLAGTTEKSPVTPGAIVPTHELLGEMLLDAQQPQQALQEFEASLRVDPNRFRGLYGAARASELSGDRDKAKTYYTQLIALAERADSERPEV